MSQFTPKNEEDCVFSLFASDGAIIPDYNIDNILRVSPFVNPIKFYSKEMDYKSMDDYKKLIEIDEENNIFYMNLGTEEAKFECAYFDTDRWIWPKSYTVLMWVKWNWSLSICTTFESGGTVPIFLSNKRMAVCKRFYSRKYCKNTMPIKEWQFVAVRAGNNCSSFYIGDLNQKPEFTETIAIDIGGGATYAIGRSTQGPGKLAMLKVFNHELDTKTLENEYYLSKYEISLQWNEEEMDAIKHILMEFVIVDGIVECVLSYCYFRSYRNLNLQNN